MIKVNGEAYLKVRFVVELDVTEEKFDNMSAFEQDNLISETIDWKEACRNAEVEEIDVWDIKPSETASV